ncbi:MAG: ferrous iron transport protein B [Deltaproteobacteria bacterium]|jgi:ferrous iron transport protein B|nr:ferrous iron transport protein B [Deltaproteobacteria bacterium]
MRFVITGNPNSGKTTLFNSLTGSNAKVGNWPGVTVDKKEGVYKLKNNDKTSEKITIVDLPGIYSLSPYTPEEVIARQFIMDEKPDLIINIVDSTNLERNLYLTTQLLEMDLPVVVALNMIDLIEQEGSIIDSEILAQKLGVPVVPVSALKSGNVKLLMRKCVEYAKTPRQGSSFLSNTDLAPQYKKALQLVHKHQIKHPVFHAIKLLENDSIELMHDVALSASIQNLKLEYETNKKTFDYEAEIADLRYKFITNEIKPTVVQRFKNSGAVNSEKIDRILTHRIWGLPVFLALMFLIFHIIFSRDFLFLESFGIIQSGLESPGVLLKSYLEDFQELATKQTGLFFENAGAATWAKGAIVDGLLTGVCSVLTFLPQILLLFLSLSLLEDSGYMSRIAFILDRALKRFGLSGKAVIPMLMGFGCSIPAMMGTRTLENLQEKRMTLMLIPFFSCGAKMVIWATIVPTVFKYHADFVIFCIYITGIVVAIISAVLLKKTVFRGIKSDFILELPTYRYPRLKSIAFQLWEKLKGFLTTVTTVIAASTLIIWFLQNFDQNLSLVSTNSDSCILKIFGDTVKWIFVPLGFTETPDSWKLIVAILTGLLAKEAVVSTMGVLYQAQGYGAEDDTYSNEESVTAALVANSVFSPLTAISFIVFNLLVIPCFAAVATARSELQSAKLTCLVIAFWFVTAWIVSFLVYQLGSWLTEINLINLIAALFIIGIILFTIFRHKNRKNKCAGCNKCHNY